jgi:hypothetical protein
MNKVSLNSSVEIEHSWSFIWILTLRSNPREKSRYVHVVCFIKKLTCSLFYLKTNNDKSSKLYIQLGSFFKQTFQPEKGQCNRDLTLNNLSVLVF